MYTKTISRLRFGDYKPIFTELRSGEVWLIVKSIASSVANQNTAFAIELG